MKRGARRMGVREIDIGKRQRPGRNVDDRIRCAGRIGNLGNLMNRGVGGEHRHVIRTGDRDGDGLRDGNAVVVLDRDRIDLLDRSDLRPATEVWDRCHPA